MQGKRIIVVGTTPDYVEKIRRRFPERAVFLSHVPKESKDTAQSSDDEVFCDLNDYAVSLGHLLIHLRRTKTSPCGVVCFDCESLDLAALIAQKLGLPFPTRESVAACRSKYAMQKAWRRFGLPCPDSELVRDQSALVAFFESRHTPVVVKPLTGSGSELVMNCSSREDCIRAHTVLSERLKSHWDFRMYTRAASPGSDASPRSVLSVEEFVDGTEYSCDFVLNSDTVRIIRIARKVPSPHQAFGTTWAYLVPASLPREVPVSAFIAQIRHAAKALGLKRAICMLDFVVRGKEAVMIELSPRPGGDCLPDLMRSSCGFDVIGFALDFSLGLTPPIPDTSKWERLVGLRLLCNREGTVSGICSRSLMKDRRVRELSLTHGPGHRVVLPPINYDSRVLGHVIFRPRRLSEFARECSEIASKLEIEMEQELCIRPRAS